MTERMKVNGARSQQGQTPAIKPTMSATQVGSKSSGSRCLPAACHPHLYSCKLMSMPCTITMPSQSSSWNALPKEMMMSVIDYLDIIHVQSLSRVDQQTYHVCVPTLFRVCPHFILPTSFYTFPCRLSNWGATKFSKGFSKTSQDNIIPILKIYSCVPRTPTQPIVVHSYLVFGQTRSSTSCPPPHVSKNWPFK